MGSVIRDNARLIIGGIIAIILAAIIMAGAVIIHKHTACELNGGWYTAATDSCGTIQENE